MLFRYQEALTQWGSYSRPNINDLNKYYLTTTLLQFIIWLMPNPIGSRQPLFPPLVIADKMKELWPNLLSSISSRSIAANFYSGKKYAEREYFSVDGRFLGHLHLFSTGLLRSYPMPRKGGFKLYYGYPRERYQLVPANFRSRFPPHDVFAAWCFQQLTEGISPFTLQKLSDKHLTIPHNLDGESTTWWIEVHTGSEGYDERVFIRRLLTMEHQLNNNKRFAVIVPFGRDVDKARIAIKKYNGQAAINGEKPLLTLQQSEILHYGEITQLREKMGFYKHKTK
ncbi:MAG: hypothetical protein HGN29_17730 [Asgard group archaeon]|nr:hypothetical protein [Asgard group archaeon]